MWDIKVQLKETKLPYEIKSGNYEIESYTAKNYFAR